MRVYFASDLHADFHTSTNHKNWTSETKDYAQRLIQNTIEQTGDIPAENVCVVDGDLSNYNAHSQALLEVLAHTFQHIVVVWGNHDYYMMSKNIASKFKNHSRNRTEALKSACTHLTNVYFLENTRVTLNGVNFFGSTMWYPLPEDAMQQALDKKVRDFTYIKGLNLELEHKKCMQAYNEALSDTENPVDIAVVHVPVTYVDRHQTQGTLCRYTPVDKFAPVTIQGHCHEQKTYWYDNKPQRMNCIGYGKFDEQDKRHNLAFDYFEYRK